MSSNQHGNEEQMTMNLKAIVTYIKNCGIRAL